MTAETTAPPHLAGGGVDEITALIQQLVRAPSRGGFDDYRPVVQVLTEWLDGADLPTRVLTGSDGGPTAVVVDVVGSRPGTHIVLDACLDTADIGDPGAWSRPPFSGDVADGWLHGRGSADSKSAIAIFCHLARELAGHRDQLAGKLTLLFDLDEHTGRFAGIRTYLEEARPDGVLIGYPGTSKIVVGGRGFYRATITVFGEAAHTASQRHPGVNAIMRATELADLLTTAIDRAPEPGFELGPALTVTGIRGGEHGSWSVVPDRCELDVDVRLTPKFTADDAESFIQALCLELDEISPVARACEISPDVEPWPAFQLPEGDPLPAALLSGARSVGLDPVLAIAGPSNIGCYLATRGIPATAGFGVDYRNFHATDEAIDLASIPAVYGAYRAAVMQLLG